MKDTSVNMEIPGRLWLRQLIISIVFTLLGILWIVAPRTGKMEWAVLLFFLIILTSLYLSWMLLPRKLEFCTGHMVVRSVITTRKITYSTVTGLKHMPAVNWWGKRYPAYQLIYGKKKVLLAGWLKGSREEREIMDKMKQHLPDLF